MKAKATETTGELHGGDVRAKFVLESYTMCICYNIKITFRTGFQFYRLKNMEMIPPSHIK